VDADSEFLEEVEKIGPPGGLNGKGDAMESSEINLRTEMEMGPAICGETGNEYQGTITGGNERVNKGTLADLELPAGVVMAPLFTPPGLPNLKFG